MSTPTIPAGNLFMNATIYTGDGSQTASFTNGAAGASFQPDMVWSKIRTGTTQSIGVFDSVRGTTGQSLDTTATTVEGTWNGSAASDYGYVSAFNSNGFSVNDGAIATTGGYVNYATRTYVAWQWKAGGTAVTNTSGSVSAQVSANTTSGFSIVTFNAGTAGNQSFGHGLGVAPSMVIMKDRVTVGYGNWSVFFSGITSSNQALYFNGTNDVSTLSNIWGSAVPTSTVVNFGSNVNVKANDNCVAYCWSQIAGYSAFGSYTGNGSADGPFIYTGFRPRFVLIKASSTSGAGYDWFIHDSSRDTYNVCTLDLEANLTATENGYGAEQDFLSNGFKLRNTGGGTNQSSVTYIYAAFAENPFKYANAR
jgi:hypothetical protein